MLSVQLSSGLLSFSGSAILRTVCVCVGGGGGGGVCMCVLCVQYSRCHSAIHGATLPLTTGLAVVCLVSVLSCRSSTVGSDCLARGSSTTISPPLSVFPSGLVTWCITHHPVNQIGNWLLYDHRNMYCTV